MFNLLVAYSGWSPPRGTISKSRFLTQTSQDILDNVFPNRTPDWDSILKLKTLFMPEVGSEAAEPYGRIGMIQNVVDRGSDYAFEFYLDQSIPPIAVEDLQEMSESFGVGRFGLATTHWSIKNNNLFELLYRKSLIPVPEGHVFRLDRRPLVSDQIALIMPFDQSFSPIRDAIAGLASSINCTCLRADDVWREDVLIQDIINLILESKIVICDVTGRNPNVFYEAGIAHALGKKVVLISQNADDIPFDLRHLRYVTYLGNSQGINDLVVALRSRVEELMRS